MKTQNSFPSLDEQASAGFPLRPSELPSPLREIVSNAPEGLILQYFLASVSPLCALLPRVRLRYYYDGRPSALLLQVIVVGAQSSGKSYVCIIEDLIMGHTLKEHDKGERQKEQDHRERKRCRKANERLEPEPLTIIRQIPPTISKTLLVKRTANHMRRYGCSLTFFMFSDELAQMVDAGKNGYSNLRTILRNSFDLGATFGIDFMSAESYSAIVDINMCTLFCATPSALDRYMDEDSIEGGNITRCILCMMPDQLGADGYRFRPYTEDQLSAIRATLDRMMEDTFGPDGALQPENHLDMKWIDSTVAAWCRAKGHQALLNGSTALDVFRKRASVKAYRMTALCYYLYQLQGTPESKARRYCKTLYTFLAEYCLHTLLEMWGERFEELHKKSSRKQKKVRFPGIYALLPERFTRQMLYDLVDTSDLCTSGRKFLYLWTKSGDIEHVENDLYRKTHKTDAK